MPLLAVNEVELDVEEHGEGDALVFVHGAGGNHASWFQQVEHFSATYRCVTFDVRGFGQSTTPHGQARASLPDDLVGLLDRLDIPSAFVVAQSAGGILGLGAAVAHPGRIRALVLSASIGTFGGLDAQRRIEAFRVSRGRAPQPYSPRWALEHPDLAARFESIRASNPSVPPGIAREPSDPQVATLERLKSCAVPMLFLLGGLDEYLPRDLVREIASVVDAEVRIIPEAGHSSYFEEPVLFNYEVASFLRAHR